MGLNVDNLCIGVSLGELNKPPPKIEPSFWKQGLGQLGGRQFRQMAALPEILQAKEYSSQCSRKSTASEVLHAETFVGAIFIDV